MNAFLCKKSRNVSQCIYLSSALSKWCFVQKNKSLHVQIDRAGRLVGPVNCQLWVCGSWIESRVCCKMGPSSNAHAGHNHSIFDLSRIKNLLVSKNVANVTDSSCVGSLYCTYLYLFRIKLSYSSLSPRSKSPHTNSSPEVKLVQRLQTRSKT